MTPERVRRLAIGRERAAFRKAILHSDLSPGAKLRALAYESYAGDGLSRVWVTDENLAKMTGQSSVNTRKKHNAELIARGVLVLVEHGNSARRTSPVYSLHYRHLGVADEKADSGASAFDAEPSVSDTWDVKNWSPKEERPSTPKGSAPSVPGAARAGDHDPDRVAARDEFTARAGAPRNSDEAAWRERVIDAALRPDVEFDAITLAAEMLAHGEPREFIERTLDARHRAYQAAR